MHETAMTMQWFHNCFESIFYLNSYTTDIEVIRTKKRNKKLWIVVFLKLSLKILVN